MKLIFILLVAATLTSCHTRYIYKHKSEICGNICPERLEVQTDTVINVDIDTIFVNTGIDSLLFNAILSGNKPDTIYVRDNNFDVQIIANSQELRARIMHLSDTLKILTKQTKTMTTTTKIETIKVPNPINDSLRIKARNRLMYILGLIFIISAIVLLEVRGWFRFRKR